MRAVGMLASLILSIDLARVTAVGEGGSEELEARWRREYPAPAAALESAARRFLARGSHHHQAFNGARVATERLTVAALESNQLFMRHERTEERPGAARHAVESSVF
jgi:hypothetical protein